MLYLIEITSMLIFLCCWFLGSKAVHLLIYFEVVACVVCLNIIFKYETYMNLFPN